MLVIVEGIDRVGKSTLASHLSKRGFVHYKDDFILRPFDKAVLDRNFMQGKFDTVLSTIDHLLKFNKNVVVDRLHLTEYAYRIARKQVGNLLKFKDAFATFDAILSQKYPDAYLVHVEPISIDVSNKEAGEDQGEIFKFLVEAFEKSRIQNKLSTNYNYLEIDAERMLLKTLDFHIYFASPFFTEEQIERERRLINLLRENRFVVFSPSENSDLKQNSTKEERKKVFDGNVKAIDECGCVFAVTDGKDVGTIWEAGYAFGVGKPVIYYCETLGNKPFNLMLSDSANLVITHENNIDFDKINKVIFGREKYTYEGLIE